MAFLDNSGDIILDAVLTDAGRKRLAKADGTFKIAKFALGDDEIDYGLYDKNNASGSAYYDLSLLQTPVLEAFTNNTSILKSRLISIPQDNLLFLPVMKLNDAPSAVSFGNSLPTLGLSSTTNGVDAGNLIYITADQNTENTNATNNNSKVNTAIKETALPFQLSGKKSYMFGYLTEQSPGAISVTQGLDTNAIPPSQTLDTSLIENQYIVEIDNRLGSIVTPNDKKTKAAISYIDDDNIASYYFSLANDADYVSLINDQSVGGNKQVITGPRGTKFSFLIAASLDLQQSTYLFELLGGTQSYTSQDGNSSTYYYIDTIVRVTGAQTGASLDLPIRFLKYKSTP
jgi:hypothetical protein